MRFHLVKTTDNMKTTIKTYSTLIILFLGVLSITAQDIPPRPQPPRLVNDFADLLSSREEQALETKLVRFNDTTSNQIAIVTLKSLGGYDIASVAYEIGEKWQVGQKGFDNGVVILVKPKVGNEKGEVTIQVGYGLEPVIPDAIAKRIIENEILPAFRANDTYGGLNAATNVLMQLAAGEISADGYQKQAETPAIFALFPFLIIIIIIILMRVTRRSSYGMGKSNMPFWTAMMLGSTMGRGSSSGFGGFGGGSGFGGGGGFGGFGGGSFGGGGASGSW